MVELIQNSTYAYRWNRFDTLPDSNIPRWVDNFLIFYQTLFPECEQDVYYDGSKVELAKELKKKLFELKEDLKKVESLDLSNSFLTEIPVELVYLENLKELDISGNPIYHLPELLFIMPHLKILTAMNCNLEEIPEAIIFSKLEKITLSFNNIQEFSSEVLKFLNQKDSIYDV